MQRRDVAAAVLGAAVVSVVLVAPRHAPAAQAGTSLPRPAPHAIAAPDGAVWATDPARDRLVVLGADGVVSKTVALPAGSHPNDITLGPDGALWFTEPGADAVARVTMTGRVRTYRVPTAAAVPWGIAAMPSGVLFFTERHADKLGAILPSRGIVAEKALPAGAAPSGIVAGADGNAWIAEAGIGRIGHYVAGVVVDVRLPSAGGIPNDVALGADGAVWVAEPAISKLARVPTTGPIREIALPAGATPAQVTTGPDGAVWAAEPGISKLARVAGSRTTQRSVLGHRAGVAAPADGSLSLFALGSAPPLRVAGAVRVVAPCAAGPVCLGVDATHPGAPLRHVGQGILHSAVSPVPASKLVTQLSPTAWRIAGLDEAPVAQSSAGAVTYVLSDHWYDQTYGQSSLDPHGQVPPWSDPPRYQAYVTSEVKKVLASGYRVDYFEVQNEPGGLCCGTVDQQLQEYKLAYDAIKAVDPSLKVMGPSLAAFADAPYPAHGYRNAGHDLDLATFLGFAASYGEHWDALSWHENDADVSLEVNSVDTPDAVLDHLRRARALLARHPEAGAPALVVNEYGGPAQRSPGWDVGYAAALERGGAASANHACWRSTDALGVAYSQCRDGSLDGLLTHDGTGFTDRGWAATFFASMAGGLLPTATTDPAVTGLASLDGDVVKVLLGRHVGCFPSTTACAPADLPAARAVAISVRVPSSVASSYVVSIERITVGTGAPTVTSKNVAVRDGVVAFRLGSLGEGDAVALTLRPL